MQNVPLRLKLTDIVLNQFKGRAYDSGLSFAQYADLLLHYQMREKPTFTNPPLGEPTPTDLYLILQLPAETKEQVNLWSERRKYNLSVFAGVIIESFLRQFDRDPRDLGMIHYISTHLPPDKILAESDLHHAITRHARPQQRNLPDAQYAQWLFTRLRPFITDISTYDSNSPLTVEMIFQILNNR